MSKRAIQDGRKRKPDAASSVDDGRTRCSWLSVMRSEEMRQYHDEEWGSVVREDDKKLFEFLVLGGAQAGLNWATILKKRAGYSRVFANWDIPTIAGLSEDALLADEGIIRNKQKVRAAIQNAKAALLVQQEFGSLATFLWSFLPEGKPIDHKITPKATPKETWPTTCPESIAMSAALKARGFSFVGSTICYAFMQTVGMVNDHTVNCFRYAEITGQVANQLQKKKRSADAAVPGDEMPRRVKTKR